MHAAQRRTGVSAGQNHGNHTVTFGQNSLTVCDASARRGVIAGTEWRQSFRHGWTKRGLDLSTGAVDEMVQTGNRTGFNGEHSVHAVNRSGRHGNHSVQVRQSETKEGANHRW